MLPFTQQIKCVCVCVIERERETQISIEKPWKSRHSSFEAWETH